MLVERGLVQVTGRTSDPGRPLLYGTTPAFLELTSTLDEVVPNASGQCENMTGAECIVTLLEAGYMPKGKGCDTNPEGAECPTADDIQLISDWLDAGAPH